jgi:hypothetical protein
MGKTSIVTILHGEAEFVPLILHNFTNFVNKADLELVVVDDGSESLSHLFCDIEHCIYIHLSRDEQASFWNKIMAEYGPGDRSLLQYEKKKRLLPNGFMRDYACGMANHDTIFHMNYDCVYHKNSVARKIKFSEKVGAECVYCDTMLCYDIFGKELYKSESDTKIYEATLYHSREFWKRKGFLWHDTDNEGKQFHYNNGSDRKMDNYYDTIQLLSVHNMNQFRAVRVTLDNIDIHIPDVVSEIKVEGDPFAKYINELFHDDISILGIESEYLQDIDINDRWKVHHILGKWKQTKLTKQVKNISSEFNVLIYSSKYPAWDLFNNVSFDIIILNVSKNRDQMISIIAQNKIHEYIDIRGVFVRKEFLKDSAIEDI